jgi:hypothetical protein
MTTEVISERSELSRLRATLSEAQAKITDLQLNLTERDDMISQVRSKYEKDVASRDASISRLLKTQREAKSQPKDQQSDLSKDVAFKLQLASMRSILIARDAALEESAAQLSTQSALVTLLSESESALKARIFNQDATITQLRSSLSEATASNALLNSNEARMKTQLSEVNNANEVMKKTLSHKDRDLANKDLEIFRLRSAVVDAEHEKKARLAELSSRHEQELTRFSKNEASLQSASARGDVAICALEQTVSQLRAALAQRDSAIAHHASELAQAAESEAVLRRTAREREACIQEKDAALKENEAALLRLSETAKRDQHSLSEAIARLNAASIAQTPPTDDKAAATREADKDSEIARLKRALQAESQERRALRVKIALSQVASAGTLASANSPAAPASHPAEERAMAVADDSPGLRDLVARGLIKAAPCTPQCEARLSQLSAQMQQASNDAQSAQARCLALAHERDALQLSLSHARSELQEAKTAHDALAIAQRAAEDALGELRKATLVSDTQKQLEAAERAVCQEEGRELASVRGLQDYGSADTTENRTESNRLDANSSASVSVAEMSLCACGISLCAGSTDCRAGAAAARQRRVFACTWRSAFIRRAQSFAGHGEGLFVRRGVFSAFCRFGVGPP